MNLLRRKCSIDLNIYYNKQTKILCTRKKGHEGNHHHSYSDNKNYVYIEWSERR
ncbi:MAG: hypothetical protein ACE5ES_00505 [Candidatus Nanoarchaeia archaeon]